MTLLRLAIATAVALAMWGLVFPPMPVSACSCQPRSPLEAMFLWETFREADVVFTGTVVERRAVPVGQGGPLDIFSWTFAVDGQTKGDSVGQSVDVWTSGDNENFCGINFRPGQRYEVFAKHRDGALKTGLCSGTRPIASWVVAEPRQAWWHVVGLAFAVGGSLGLIVWFRRQAADQ